MRLPAAVGLLLLAGCIPHQLPRPTKPLTIEIALEHVAQADAWRVRYRFPERLREVRFKDQEYPFRSTSWKVESSGVKLVRERDGDVLATDSADGTSEVSLIIPNDTRRPEKAGPLVTPFTDGSQLVHSGYFDVEPKDSEGRPVRTLFTFIPRHGERVIVLGVVSEGAARWESTGEGTEVYFGQAMPVVTRDLVLVVDTGAPSWLVERTTDLFPRLFAIYGERTSQHLDFKPVVFLSYHSESDRGVRSLGGSTLPGMVQLDLRLGSDFERKTDERLVQDIVLLVAHEAAHFWNAQMFRNDDGERGGDWMHEGGADTFAFRALLSLGAMTRQDYTDRLSQALSGCMLGLQGASLHQSSEAGRTKNAYNCGNVIALLTEAALRRRDPHQDIFGFWGELFRKSVDHGYSEATYLAVLRSHGGDDAASVIQSMLTSTGSGSTLAPALAALGVETVIDDNASSRDYVQLAGKLACRAVIDQDCGEHSMVSEAGDRCTIDPESTCTTLRPGSSLRAVGAHPIFREGPAAYDDLMSRCAAGAPIAVTTGPDGPATELRCSRPPPARPPYRRIVALPFELEPNGTAPPASPAEGSPPSRPSAGLDEGV